MSCIKRDTGVITLKSGSLAFTAPAMGRDTIAVFDGRRRIHFHTALRDRPELYGEPDRPDRRLRKFDRALFCFTDDTGKEIRASAKSHSNDPKLADILREYRKHLRSRLDQPRSMLEYLLTGVPWTT